MGNRKHLQQLSKGVSEWNAWREETFSRIRPNLDGSNLAGQDLTGIDLRQASLREADLTDATLDRALFDGADMTRATCVDAFFSESRFPDVVAHDACFQGANLHNTLLSDWRCERASFKAANLSASQLVDMSANATAFDGARFSGASLTRCDFRDASLRSALLDEAFIRSCQLDRADLYKALFGNTALCDLKLEHVRGLSDIRHSRPSFIDVRTLLRSGELPINFLRGLGTPELVIDYLPALRREPIQFSSCFISYSSVDSAFAERLYADLQARGVRCWFAPEDLKIGDRTRDVIDRSIHVHERLLVVLSAASIESNWVRNEVEAALEKEDKTKRDVLFPVRIDEAVMETSRAWAAMLRRERNIGDFTNWLDLASYREAFQRVLRDLQPEARSPQPAENGASEADEEIPF